MNIRDATMADLEFIAGASKALALETDGHVLDPGLLLPGIRAVLVFAALNPMAEDY